VVSVDIDRDHRGTLLRELQGDATSNAAARAGHDRELATERFACRVHPGALQSVRFVATFGVVDEFTHHLSHLFGVGDRHPVPCGQFTAPVLRHPSRKIFGQCRADVFVQRRHDHLDRRVRVTLARREHAADEVGAVQRYTAYAVLRLRRARRDLGLFDTTQHPRPRAAEPQAPGQPRQHRHVKQQHVPGAYQLAQYLADGPRRGTQQPRSHPVSDMVEARARARRVRCNAPTQPLFGDEFPALDRAPVVRDQMDCAIGADGIDDGDKVVREFS
jgi:hypothetical protein